MLFPELDKIRAAVVGDFCLDVYWYADMTKSELSRETPHFPLPVTKEVTSPGGAGNVANNLAALKIDAVYAIGVAGCDWRGEAMLGVLESKGINTSGIVRVSDRFTNTYIKPCKVGYSGVPVEDARIDFEAREALDEKSEAEIIKRIDEIAAKVDVICVCDQMAFGCITPAVRERLMEIGRAGKTVIVDSRDRIGLYTDVIVKPNDIEAARAAGESDPAKCAGLLSQKTGKPAIVTCGADGCVVFENGEAAKVPANKNITGETDICGAGDTFLSAFSVSVASGKSLKDSAVFANAASCVTVHKLGQTGVASREEIAEIL